MQPSSEPSVEPTANPSPVPNLEPTEPEGNESQVRFDVSMDSDKHSVLPTYTLTAAPPDDAEELSYIIGFEYVVLDLVGTSGQCTWKSAGMESLLITFTGSVVLLVTPLFVDQERVISFEFPYSPESRVEFKIR